MLTIAIPTFNRNKLLKECVLRILPQLHSGVQLLILDNASDTPIIETLKHFPSIVNAKNIRTIRNPCNIGGGANIMRCLELCETKWLYCLGDDDLVTQDCVEQIEKTVSVNNDSLYVSFSRSWNKRLADVRTDGADEFVKSLKDWSSFLFMSTTVINAAVFKKYCNWGNLYTYSWAPFQAILIKILNEGSGVVLFSNSVICESESLSELTWNPFPIVAGRMVLPELFDDPRLRKKFAKTLFKAYPKPFALIYTARTNSDNKKELHKYRFLLNMYYNRCEYYLGSLQVLPFRIISYVILRPIIFPSWILFSIDKLATKVFKRNTHVSQRFGSERT